MISAPEADTEEPAKRADRIYVAHDRHLVTRVREELLQTPPSVATKVTHGAIESAQEPRMSRDEQQQPTAGDERLEHALQGQCVVRDVLEDVQAEHAVETHREFGGPTCCLSLDDRDVRTIGKALT